MKCHFSMNTVQMGVLDLDKKLPFIKDHFPDSKFEKNTFAETDFIIIRDVLNNVKLISFNDTECEINLNADLYTTSFLGYSFLDLNFEITGDMVDELSPFNLLSTYLTKTFFVKFVS